MAKIEGVEVLVLHSVAGPKHLTFGKGEKVILPKEIADEWIKSGLAQLITQEQEEVKTVKKRK